MAGEGRGSGGTETRPDHGGSGHQAARQAALMGFRAMLVVLRHHSLSIQTTLYHLRAVFNAAIVYQGMHPTYWMGQLEEVESKVRRLMRGYEGILTEEPRCVL